MGVSRAVDFAVEEAARSGGQGVYTFGPLIHNPKVLADLKAKGVRTIDEQPENPWDRVEIPSISNPEGCVVVRAHGISPVIEKKLRENGYRIVDATCPRVKTSQLKAEELATAGYGIFLAGSASHAEIESIMGYAQGANAQYCAVVENPFEAKKAALKFYRMNSDAKTALLGQTTITENEYLVIGEALREYFPNIEIIDTICAATTERQQALRELLTEVDAVIIAGGKESANTLRLFAIAEESGKPCALIEDAREIPTPFRFFDKVGLCAGASTPDSLLSEIEMEFLR